MKVLIVALSCLLCCGQLRAQGTEGTFRSELVSPRHRKEYMR